MNRAKKYPETETFHYFNANPKNRITEDCVYRAVTMASGLPYETVVRGMAEMFIKTGYCPQGNNGMKSYLTSIGFVEQKQPRKSDNTKYTGKEFCEFLNRTHAPYKGIVANIGGHHTVCFQKVDGKWKVVDIWDSTEGSIGKYFILK